MIHPSKAENHPSNPKRDPTLLTTPTASKRTAGAGPGVGGVPDPVSGRWPYGGFGFLPFVVERGTSEPASDATWAWSLRRLARLAVWSLPGYAIVYGSVTLVGAGDAPFLTQPRPAHLLGWIGALWLGLLALMALASLLVTTRTRGVGTAGLLVAVAGTMLVLPFGGLPDPSAEFGRAGQVIAVSGGVLYSVGWWLTGLALYRSGVFSQSDGVLLMIAAPLLGVGGMLASALHALGAMFVLAAGIGIAWRARRLVPAVGRAGLTRPVTSGAVAASVSGGSGLGVAPAGGGLGPATPGPTPS
ncbi:hypothetical protein GCM10022225_56830 [Plantactinospora mayteni]|uniref:Integral membrane protein n=1 Tax=Plantactinospora mayteni TaxID=566021 RepID=A0ABQ4EUJ3_9ACTN|nr:hypothetical protein [Plantactinospora mayteni]GIG98280.1 hypothetical protein Pma05_48530 [Plantactinospora mayteni]